MIALSLYHPMLFAVIVFLVKNEKFLSFFFSKFL
jgi:hypothetical protein